MQIELSMDRIGFFYAPGWTGREACPTMGRVLIKTPAIDPRYAQFRLSIRKSKIHRRGVYAEEPIPARRKVIEYTGERISRRKTKQRGAGPVTYLFTLDDYRSEERRVGKECRSRWSAY